MRYFRLKDLCSDMIDCPHTTPEWKSSGVYVVRNFNLKSGRLDLSNGCFVDEETYISRTQRAVPEAGDIILSREAPVGLAAIIPEGLKCCLGQRLVLLKADRSRISPQYLIFALLSEQVQTQFRRADSTGSIVSNLCISDLGELLVPVCSEDKQEQIVRILGGINQVITINERQCVLLEQQLRLIYDFWFIQRGFSDKTGDWQKKELLELVNWVSGSQPPKSEHISEPRPGYVRFIQNRDYSDSRYAEYIPASHRNKLCTEMDIMIDKYGNAGETRFGISGAYSVALSKLDVRESNMREYIRSYLSSAEIKRYLSGSSMASTRASLSKGTLAFLSVEIPPEELLEKYECLASEHISRIISLKKSSLRLEQMRDRLIPEMFV